MCLVLQESTTGGTVVQSVQKCVSATGSWQPLTAADLTTQTAGDSVGFMIRQTGAKAGDSLQADSLTLTEFSSPPPPPKPKTGNCGCAPGDLQCAMRCSAHH